MIVVNTTYQLAPWADVLYACDMTWWQMHFNHVAGTFPGELWTVSDAARDHYGVCWIYGCDGAGLAPKRDYIHTGKNSGYQAISLAHLFGATRITLLGFDFRLGTDGKKHWHGDHPPGLGNGGLNRYQVWAQDMKQLAKDLEVAGCKVLNASKRTALTCYKRATLETALNEI